MKPISNRVYCRGCRHTKIFFASEAKANNFIRFNGEEIRRISGKAPSRSYYCTFCCGWHVSSIENLEKSQEADASDAAKWERIFTRHASLLNSLQLPQHSSDPFIIIDALCHQCRSSILTIHLDEAIAIFKQIQMEEKLLRARRKLEKLDMAKLKETDQQIRYLQSTLDIIAAFDIDTETRLAYINRGEYSKNTLARTYLQMMVSKSAE